MGGDADPENPAERGHHETELRGLVHDLVEGDAGEVGELELDDRPQPRQRGADPAADEAALGQRCVADPLGAEALVEPLGRAEEPPDPADVLADHEHVGIGLELERETPRGRRRRSRAPLGLDGRGWVAALRREDGRHQVGRVGVEVLVGERRLDRVLHVALDLPRECVERLVVQLARGCAADARAAGQRIAPSHSSTSAGSRTSGRFARIECCIRRKVFISRNVGPEPSRARASARSTAASTASRSFPSTISPGIP